MAAALSSPLLSSALPLRVAAFSLQGPERDKVQLLIHAEIGTDYPSPRVVSAGYVIADRNGKQIDTKARAARPAPAPIGLPPALQYPAGPTLPPGDSPLHLSL